MIRNSGGLLRQLDPTLLGEPGSAYPPMDARADDVSSVATTDEWVETPDAVVDARRPRQRRGSPEMLVEANDLRRSLAVVRRRGRAATLEYWLAQEPVLTRHLIDGVRGVYRRLLQRADCGPARDAAILHEAAELILASLAAWAGGQYRLWSDTAMGERLAQFDPRLADDPPGDAPR